MKKITFKGFGLVLTLITFTSVAVAQSTVTREDLSIFPKPEAGYKKMVIDVPHSQNDAHKKIEFTIGKIMEVDGCNHFGLQGTLEKKDLVGWGYNYYVFKTNGQVVSTQMACPGQPKRQLFVSAAPEIANYNGRLPIVIYVPQDYDVQFKIYKAEDDVFHASEVRQDNK
ncbi:ecotin [Sphingobacterium suaedae]|uniref:Ecotin n=1 Tax=Sphingobacterium suaedae TaxID=1686402 RepID=A0ABW5KMN3_9SPHI